MEIFSVAVSGFRPVVAARVHVVSVVERQRVKTEGWDVHYFLLLLCIFRQPVRF